MPANTGTVLKFYIVLRAENLIRMGQKRREYKILMMENLGKDQTEERDTSEDKMNRMEAGCEDGWCMELAQDRVLCCAIILAVN
jgi:hypothetical protein